MNRKNLFRIPFLAAWLVLASSPATEGTASSETALLRESALQALDKAIVFFRTLSIHGGYVHRYDLESGQRWGESPTDDQTIEVQPPGTPTVGAAFLRAFKTTGKHEYLKAADEAAEALIAGQNELGGWNHTIHFDRPKENLVSFDDNQTQSAIRFLMALEQESELQPLRGAVDRALQMMVKSQFENGAWPHRYPKQGTYHDFATFNDGGINDCISVMMDAHRFYRESNYFESLQLGGSFLLLSQLPPPQPGWAQQYNQYLQPAWARSFEPPSACTLVTVRNINTLLDLALSTKQSRFLEPIPDALAWLRQVKLPSGLWPRFVELGTNRPLYYDRGRLRVNSVEELHIERRTGYIYEQDLSDAIAQAAKRFEEVKEALLEGSPRKATDQFTRITESLLRKIIAEQDEGGRWVSRKAAYKVAIPGKVWNGEYAYRDQVRSSVFVDYVNVLCDYLKQTQ